MGENATFQCGNPPTENQKAQCGKPTLQPRWGNPHYFYISGREGHSVVVLTGSTAAIQNSITGNTLIYRKTRKPAFGP